MPQIVYGRISRREFSSWAFKVRHVPSVGWGIWLGPFMWVVVTTPQRSHQEES